MKRNIIVISFLILIIQGCAPHPQRIKEEMNLFYPVAGAEADTPEMIKKWAPVFLVYGYDEKFNRIGSPAAKYNTIIGDVKVYVDTSTPAAFYMLREFKGKKGKYTNLIYRVHFPEVPFSLIPFNLSFGRNVGLLVVITLNEEEKPVLVTTVHTCGCYKTITPVSNLASESYPDDWKNEKLKIYGERLPAQLDYSNISNPRLLVYIRPENHRVMDLKVIDDDAVINTGIYQPPDMQLVKMESLEMINLDGNMTSFYNEKGIRKGYVKGAIKPWETLLLSPVSLDLFVGSDKKYGNRKDTGTTFYTSLKPWYRKKSDMWNFADFLRFWGWRL